MRFISDIIVKLYELNLFHIDLVGNGNHSKKVGIENDKL